MSTTTLTETANGAPGTRTTAAPLTQTVAGAMRAELIKLTSLRSIQWTLASAIVLGLCLATVAALNLRGMFEYVSTSDAYAQYLTASFSLPVMFLMLVFGVLGVFAMTSEYSSGMILSTLTAVPNRCRLFFAKLSVVAIAAAVCAAVLAVGSALIAVIIEPAAATALTHPAVWSGVLGSVATLVFITLFSFGVAGVFRSTAAGVAVLAAVTFVVPIALNILSMSGWAWVQQVTLHIPLSLAQSLGSGIQAEVDPTFQLPYGLAMIAFLVWALASLVPAAILFQKRDAQ